MSPFNPDTPVLQTQECAQFSVVSLVINSAMGCFFFCLFLSRTSGIWMLIVLNRSSIVFLLSVFFSNPITLVIIGRSSSALFPLDCFYLCYDVFHFQKSFFYFLNLPFYPLLVLAPWVQYLCLLLIIVTIALFIFTFPLWSLLPPSHW